MLPTSEYNITALRIESRGSFRNKAVINPGLFITAFGAVTRPLSNLDDPPERILFILPFLFLPILCDRNNKGRKIGSILFLVKLERNDLTGGAVVDHDASVAKET
jgi:hypothetical protein